MIIRATLIKRKNRYSNFHKKDSGRIFLEEAQVENDVDKFEGVTTKSICFSVEIPEIPNGFHLSVEGSTLSRFTQLPV